MLGYSTSREDLGTGDECRGVLRTGDLGYVDDEGFLFITGRNTRMTKVFGLRVNLEEVEGFAAGAGVPIAAVGAGDRIIVFVESLLPKDQTRCREDLLAEFSLEPSILEIRLVDRLPRNVRGKVDYSELSKWI